MNLISIYPKEVDYLHKDGIEFHINTFIEVMIDGELIKDTKAFEDGEIFWPELKRSIEKSGNYLIFTCICGVAEDAGWEEINVIHKDNTIIWEFERNSDFQFRFDKEDYIKEVNLCESLLNLSAYPLGVESVIRSRKL